MIYFYFITTIKSQIRRENTKNYKLYLNIYENKSASVIAQPFILLISGNKTDDKLESEVDNLNTRY